MAHKLILNKQYHAVAGKAHSVHEQDCSPCGKCNNPASRSICFFLGYFKVELDWAEYEKEGRKTDPRSKRLDLLGKMEGISSSGEGG